MEHLKSTAIGLLPKSFLIRLPEPWSLIEDRIITQEGKRVKEFYKNGVLIGRVPLDDLLSLEGRPFIPEEYVPSFAQGRCVNISNGDYKTVMIDHDGRSDYVIKRYGFWNIYRGEGALERANRAAVRIAQIYAVIEETSGLRILPNRMFASSYSRTFPQDYAVFEIQQRGLFINHWQYLEPVIANRIDKAKDRGSARYREVTIPEILKRGLVSPSVFDPKDILDHMTLYISWDAISNTVVARDVVDAISVD